MLWGGRERRGGEGGGVIVVASFKTIDEQLQQNWGCYFPHAYHVSVGSTLFSQINETVCVSVVQPKPVRGSPASSSLRRTSSLDTIGTYLKGQWPVDIGGCHHTLTAGSFMCDKMTQVHTAQGTYSRITSGWKKGNIWHWITTKQENVTNLAPSSVTRKSQDYTDTYGTEVAMTYT